MVPHFKRVLINLFILLLPGEFLLSQQMLDHRIFLDRIEHSTENIYKECIAEYEKYLQRFPDDVSVMIEKCNFIRYAQYDADQDYNPNQEEFDSCAAALVESFPVHPEVLVFQTTYLWGDELEEVFRTAENSINEMPGEWTREELAAIYKAISNHYYYNSDNVQALLYAARAILNEEQYGSSIEYARILVELGKKEDALRALVSHNGESDDVWQLSQRASLLLKIEEYDRALEVYNLISSKDSTYIDNFEVARTFEGIENYEIAREYLVADTSKHWSKETAIRNLLKHDLKYQDGSICIATYNRYRDLGFKYDPLGFYRLNLFFAHPLQPWRLRDIPAIITLALTLIILMLIPYLWVLPVYFAGNRWSFITNRQPLESPWSLKMFWIISIGFLTASLFACMADPEIIYSYVNSSYSFTEVAREITGLQNLIFISIMAVFGFVALYKVNYRVLLSDSWSTGKSVLIAVGVLFAFRIVSGLYIQIGVSQFGISIDDLAFSRSMILGSKQEIEALVNTYGKGAGLLLIGIIGPFYEEVLFRGVILGSCQRLLKFDVANIFQATLFAAIHQNLIMFPVFLLFGLITGIMSRKAGGLLPSLVFHIVNNSMVVLFLFARSG